MDEEIFAFVHSSGAKDRDWDPSLLEGAPDGATPSGGSGGATPLATTPKEVGPCARCWLARTAAARSVGSGASTGPCPVGTLTLVAAGGGDVRPRAARPGGLQRLLRHSRRAPSFARRCLRHPPPLPALHTTHPTHPATHPPTPHPTEPDLDPHPPLPSSSPFPFPSHAVGAHATASRYPFAPGWYRAQQKRASLAHSYIEAGRECTAVLATLAAISPHHARTGEAGSPLSPSAAAKSASRLGRLRL